MSPTRWTKWEVLAVREADGFNYLQFDMLQAASCIFESTNLNSRKRNLQLNWIDLYDIEFNNIDLKLKLILWCTKMRFLERFFCQFVDNVQKKLSVLDFAGYEIATNFITIKRLVHSFVVISRFVVISFQNRSYNPPKTYVLDYILALISSNKRRYPLCKNTIFGIPLLH